MIIRLVPIKMMVLNLCTGILSGYAILNPNKILHPPYGYEIADSNVISQNSQLHERSTKTANLILQTNLTNLTIGDATYDFAGEVTVAHLHT